MVILFVGGKDAINIPGKVSTFLASVSGLYRSVIAAEIQIVYVILRNVTIC